MILERYGGTEDGVESAENNIRNDNHSICRELKDWSNRR